jgi:hypothetical protein
MAGRADHFGGVNNTNTISLVVKEGDDVVGEEATTSPMVQIGKSGQFSAELFNKGRARAINVLATAVD